MEEDLIAALLADASLLAVVGRRVNWDTRPQGSGLPAVCLTMASGPDDLTMDGPDGLVGYLVQVECWGGRKADATAAARAARATLVALKTAPFSGCFVENRRSSFEPGDAPQGGAATVNFFRTDLDVRVWHRSAA